jgi:hypothetical protein
VSSDAPKSAYEIAMEKLRARDRERGEAAAKPLTDEQREKIAEVRRFYEAKLAEREILHRSERRKVAHDPDKLREQEENYAADRRRLESERDAKIAKIRE